MSARPFECYAFWADRPMGGDGGGMCTPIGRVGSLAAAMKRAEDRLRGGWELPFDRVQVRKPGEHPWWFYLDADARLCVFQKRPWEKHDAWGFCS